MYWWQFSESPHSQTVSSVSSLPGMSQGRSIQRRSRDCELSHQFRRNIWESNVYLVSSLPLGCEGPPLQDSSPICFSRLSTNTHPRIADHLVLHSHGATLLNAVLGLSSTAGDNGSSVQHSSAVVRPPLLCKNLWTVRIHRGGSR